MNRYNAHALFSKVITKYRHTIKVTLNTVNGINNPHEWPYFIVLRELHSYTYKELSGSMFQSLFVRHR